MAKILIVEDDDFLRDLYTDTLKGEGHEIEAAEDGEVAYQKMKQGGFDLVLLDIILPKMNGVDIMEKLSSEPPGTPNKCVLFLTNIDKGEEIKKALQLGNGYLIKSQITPGDLIQEVNLFLSQPLRSQ
jgi:two-component system alkaline phosphatase synthesis response regulator PhoP/two-component system response regulator VicR